MFSASTDTHLPRVRFCLMQNKMILYTCIEIAFEYILEWPDIGKSSGPWSWTDENSGGPMKTLIVPVLVSGKKFLFGGPLWGL